MDRLFFILAFAVVTACAGAAVAETGQVRRIKEAIVLVPNLGTHNIVIDDRRGDVTLTGEVAFPEDRRRIEAAVAAVPGVDSVDNRLQVVSRGRFVGANDLLVGLKQRIEQVPLDAPEYQLSQEGETVVVSGIVGSEESRRALISAVRTHPGVREVRDELVVRKPGDAEVMRQVEDALQREGLASRITARYHAETVELSGDLADRDAVDRLLAQVLMVPGVKDVQSRITVNGQPYMTEAYHQELRRRTGEALGK